LQNLPNFAINEVDSKKSLRGPVKDIGQRIRSERERKKVSQEKLAKALGWNHHQIVSEMEQGKREIKAWELYEIAKFLQVNLAVLIGNEEPLAQPYVLWRQKPSQDQKLLEARFINECDNYLWVEQAVSSADQPTIAFEELPRKKIDFLKFTLDHAYRLAESVRQLMALGDFPAAQLLGVLEDRYGVKFIVDPHHMPSSAVCSRSDRGCFILINGRNSESRQYFSIAHELFHLITWDQEMLELIEENISYHEKNEQLANAFAAGLLIPKEKLQTEAARICGPHSMTAPDVVALAEQFQTSKDAMLYRMVNVNLISNKQFKEIKERLQQAPRSKESHPTVTHFLRSKYVRLVYLAYAHVKISRAKAAKLLHVDLCDLSDLFNEYGFVEFEAL
jgi:Zn-dependent peptidase ImmA (M78 family)/transcriptional regulator with XRE-family HTH domain